MRVDFEYLKPFDGGVVEILAELGSRETEALTVSAPVIGATRSTVRRYVSREKSSRVVELVQLAVVTLLGAYALHIRITRYGGGIWFIVPLIVMLASGFLALYVTVRDWQFHRIPKFAQEYFGRGSG